MVTERGGGYTWCGNSSQAKLTPWYNDPVCDPTGSFMLIMNKHSGRVCQIEAGTLAHTARTVRCGFGYSLYTGEEGGIRMAECVFTDDDTAAVRYALGRTAKEAFKEAFFSFLQGVPDADAWAEDFWRTHERRFRPWYLAQKQPDDLVVSASPEFLLAPACRRLGIRPPIASRVDARTGRYTGLNCKGAEKGSRFREQYPDAEIGQFYSDSRSDAPLAHLARRAFLVRGDSYTSWEV